LMQRKLIVTDDGSHSICIPELNVTYHSVHGAIRESKHVFIEAGLHHLNFTAHQPVHIFEVGFGTGLNALLTLIDSEESQRNIYYETIEMFPLTNDEVKRLNYCEILEREDLRLIFEQFHTCEWGKEITITPNFILKKTKTNLLTFQFSGSSDLIFFDAFDPNAQPELWAPEIFQKMFSILQQDGVLVTYSSKGDVRRAMQAAGFSVEKIPGPPGKREIIRALKVN
jgi:tRNA U34 5-methylaminomethyl-2-thiouridine-forming methyltransferase MnmC